MNQEQRLNDLFDQAKQLPTAYSFLEVKAQFVAAPTASVPKTANSQRSAHRPAGGKGKPTIVSLKNIFIMLSIASITVLSIWLFSGSSEAVVPGKQKTIKTKQEIQHQTNNEQSTITATESSRELKQLVLPAIPGPQTDEPVPATIASLPPINEETESFISEFPRNTPIDEYQFPKLTEEEIAANHKRKKRMLKALEKHDNKIYAYVPSGSFDYDGKVVSVQAFYMGVAEVTNLEYRTFLFDLLINNRKDEFLKAKPDQTQWVVMFKGGMQAFQDYYFSHPAYDDYPVVNISGEGAEMYCRWLTEEVLKAVDEKKRATINDVRIPTRVEWVKAASNEGKQLPYPWDGPYVRNSKGQFQANFTVAESDSIPGSPEGQYADVLAPVKSFWPNALGFFNMAGNAAEMVVETGTEIRIYKSKEEGEAAGKAFEMGTAGGSWRSSGKEIQITAADPYKGKVLPKPTIGFRVVFTWLPR